MHSPLCTACSFLHTCNFVLKTSYIFIPNGRFVGSLRDILDEQYSATKILIFPSLEQMILTHEKGPYQKSHSGARSAPWMTQESFYNDGKQAQAQQRRVGRTTTYTKPSRETIIDFIAVQNSIASFLLPLISVSHRNSLLFGCKASSSHVAVESALVLSRR